MNNPVSVNNGFETCQQFLKSASKGYERDVFEDEGHNFLKSSTLKAQSVDKKGSSGYSGGPPECWSNLHFVLFFMFCEPNKIFCSRCILSILKIFPKEFFPQKLLLSTFFR